jgi:hypothetical protein
MRRNVNSHISSDTNLISTRGFPRPYIATGRICTPREIFRLYNFEQTRKFPVTTARPFREHPRTEVTACLEEKFHLANLGFDIFKDFGGGNVL